jgi:ornithine cyclodeaminase/alanine dehydrogenase-like protein (mu-crystallin family)
MDRPTMILSGSDVERLLDVPACIAAVEDAFRRRAEGGASPAGVLGVHVRDGGFHVKAAALELRRPWFAAKVNANFPGNRAARGLPTIQGVLALFDAASGVPLALMDSMAVTTLRTAAASAVAAKFLARAGAASVAVVGCGVQAYAHITALHAVRPLTALSAFDTDRDAAVRLASHVQEVHGMSVRVADDVGAAVAGSAIVVTCTPSRRAFLGARHLAPGAFVAAVGADSEEKIELEPGLMRDAAVVVDDLEQCSTIGDLHHALAAGVTTREAVRATLGEVVMDASRGRRNDDEVVVFDSTGVAIEDVAAAAVVYERALAAGAGLAFQLGG